MTVREMIDALQEIQDCSGEDANVQAYVLGPDNRGIPIESIETGQASSGHPGDPDDVAWIFTSAD